MKVILLLTILAVTAIASPIEQADDWRENGENGWWVPQLDGSMQWVDKNEYDSKAGERAQEGQRLSTTPVHFFLYTKSNPTKAQEISWQSSSVWNSNFNPSNPTRFVIHGWTQSKSSGMNKHIRDAWLSKGNFNVIIVDWARARSVDYATSVIAVETVGKKVASMIDFLAWNHGMSMDTLHVIGHSLGAHVSGYAGKNVKAGRISAIFGLDPALPLFSYNSPNARLSNTDASYVETIQTDGGGLGFLKPIGKASFYPNGGKSQPGCPLDVTGACGHGRSVTYYAEAVEKNDFPTMKCNSYQEATKKNCGSTYSSVRMAADTNSNWVQGDYYVPVKSKAPHGMGS